MDKSGWVRPDDTDRLLIRERETCTTLGICVATLRKLTDKGKVPYVQLYDGYKGRRYSLDTLKAWIFARLGQKAS